MHYSQKMTFIIKKSLGCETEAILAVWGGSPLASALRRKSPNISVEPFALALIAFRSKSINTFNNLRFSHFVELPLNLIIKILFYDKS